MTRESVARNRSTDTSTMRAFGRRMTDKLELQHRVATTQLKQIVDETTIMSNPMSTTATHTGKVYLSR
jgi:hypothetical protein